MRRCGEGYLWGLGSILVVIMFMSSCGDSPTVLRSAPDGVTCVEAYDTLYTTVDDSTYISDIVRQPPHPWCVLHGLQVPN